jgi:hypothetical protein
MRLRDIISAGILILFSIGGIALPAAAQEWPPITDEEKALKDCPQQPGAPAVILYREETTSHRTWTASYFYRLKILTPAGRDYANIEIPGFYGWKATDLKARVVRPDGTPVPYTGPVFEKTALSAGRVKITVKTFALPDVDAGSIIEYGYKLVPDEKASSKGQVVLDDIFETSGKPEEGGIDGEAGILFFPVLRWEIQANLFTLKAVFNYEPSPWFGTALAEYSQMPVIFSWFKRWVPNAEPSGDNKLITLGLRNIPAFEPEELMPPEITERAEVRLFYIAATMATPDDYWRAESQNWQKGLAKFMSKPGTAAGEAAKAVFGLTDPEAKIQALYERAQKIKNLSYDKAVTARKRRELGIKDNRSVADVFKTNRGLRSDITRTFAAMAGSAGFPARVVRVVTRDDKLFDANACGLYGQFDCELAVLTIDGKDRFYDPATPFCPPGVLRWACTSTAMLDPTQGPPSVLKKPAMTPAGTSEQALTRREISLQLDAEGNLTGTARVHFGGQEGLVRRLDHLNDDAVTVKKDLEEELGGILPEGAKATLKSVENLKTSADEVVADFEITLPGLATRSGERMFLPSSPLLGPKQHPFRHAARKIRISFPYPYQVSDDIVISLPAGMTVETVPAPKTETRAGFEYALSSAVENGTSLHVRRDFKLKKCDFLISDYAGIRAFFDRVRAADEEQVVLSAKKDSKEKDR